MNCRSISVATRNAGAARPSPFWLPRGRSPKPSQFRQQVQLPRGHLFLFTATSTTTAITLTGAAGVQYIGLDNVSVNPAATPAMPEPGPFALVTAGMGLLGVIGRKLRLRGE